MSPVPYDLDVRPILREGGEKARALSAPVVREVYDTVGFLRP